MSSNCDSTADRPCEGERPVAGNEAAPPRAKKWTYKKGVRHFKVIDMLRAEDRAPYLARVREPSSTVASCLAWLVERGYAVARDSVYRHRKYLLKDAAEIRRAAEFAHEFVQLARAGGEDGGGGGPRLAGAFAEATQTAFEQFFMQGVLEMKKQGKELEPRQWGELSRAVASAVSARRQVESMRAEFDERARKAAEAVEKAAGTGRWRRLDGAALSDKVRRILGMPLPGEPIPGLPAPASAGGGAPGDR
jgi:hypothetical protein